MTVKWLQSALDNLVSIADYIALDNPVRAKTFVQEIRQKSNLLVDFPNVGRAGRVLGTRELVVHKNYILVYRVRAQKVEILSVYNVTQQTARE
jgi:toxin ParE1/3/4